MVAALAIDVNLNQTPQELTHSAIAVSQDFKEFDIDMDAPPRQRLYESAAYFREDILVIMKEFMAEIPKAVVDMFDYTYWIWYYTQNEKYEEMMGIVEAVDSPDLSIGKCVLLNALYELESWCTSIIVQ